MLLLENMDKVTHKQSYSYVKALCRITIFKTMSYFDFKWRGESHYLIFLCPYPRKQVMVVYVCVEGGGVGERIGDIYIVFQIFEEHSLVFFDVEVVCCLLELLMRTNREIN